MKDEETSSRGFWAILGLAAAICVAICIVGFFVTYLIVGDVSDPKDLWTVRELAERRAWFGDSWGGVNALISALAFAGVVATLYLQNADLKLQRKELKDQREVFEKESETIKYQRFENLFYNMLNLQQRIVDGLRIEYEDQEVTSVPLASGGMGYEDRKVHREVTGRDVFRYAFESYELPVKDDYGNTGKVFGFRNVLCYQGLKSYDSYWIPTIFDHYFRHLYKILQFVDSQGFSFVESYRYISFLRGTLSRYELVWIYYNELLPENYKFKKLIEKYSIMKNLRPELLTLSLEAEAFYTSKGLKANTLKRAGFSSGEFEYRLTTNPEEINKYQISAFWKKEDIYEGEKVHDAWKAFVLRFP